MHTSVYYDIFYVMLIQANQVVIKARYIYFSHTIFFLVFAFHNFFSDANLFDDDVNTKGLPK